jgi:putative endonuclease
MKHHNYYIYIVSNPGRTVLYTGVTNNLEQRIIEHYLNKGSLETFAGKYYCYNLLYYERFQFSEEAISREKEIKGWTKDKKISLIKTINPKLHSFNKEVIADWPPHEAYKRNDPDV